MFLVGIAGGSGSGKTTFAKKVKKLVSEKINLLHMDSYYLDQIPKNIWTPKEKPNFDHPEAFDWELLRNHLTLLKSGHGIEMPTYDFVNNRRIKEKHSLTPSDIVLIEGIFALYCPEIRKLLDVMCFIDVESDIRFTRRLHRDIKERGRTLNGVVEQYYETVRPMYKMYLEPQKQYADIIVGEENSKAASILAARLNQVLDNPNDKSHPIKRELSENISNVEI